LNCLVEIEVVDIIASRLGLWLCVRGKLFKICAEVSSTVRAIFFLADFFALNTPLLVLHRCLERFFNCSLKVSVRFVASTACELLHAAVAAPGRLSFLRVVEIGAEMTRRALLVHQVFE